MLERLTIRTDICIEPENEIVYHNPNDPEGMYNILDLAECLYSGGEAEAGMLMGISRRLAAYEDSQMTPEEVQALAKAKADGRLGVFPCKTGDTVYVVSSCLYYRDETPYTPCEVVVFKQGKQRGVMMHLRPLCEEAAGTRYHRWFPVTSIGKTVFLTREEAEKALEVGKP